ncbi:MAG TPA: hypothetical protein VF331_16370 [Polyangiales bacterium]
MSPFLRAFASPKRKRYAPAVFAPRRVAELDVSAASGLVATPDALWVIADDELFLSAYSYDGRPLQRVALWPGELPAEHAERKRRKPDLEALTLLPDGRLLALGSGSTAARSRGALVEPRELRVQRLDLSALHAALRARIPELNLEGAAVVGERLWLAQRGNGVSHFNACIELDLESVLAQLDAAATLGAQGLRGIHPLALGELEGVALSLTDLAAHPDGGLLFTAAAEASADTYADGRCTGSVVGALSERGELRAILPVQASCKLEGIAVADRELWLVSDPDDRAKHAELFRAPLCL